MTERLVIDEDEGAFMGIAPGTYELVAVLAAERAGERAARVAFFAPRLGAEEAQRAADDGVAALLLCEERGLLLATGVGREMLLLRAVKE